MPWQVHHRDNRRRHYLHVEAKRLKVREHSELIFLARCLEPGNVCHSITTRETPKRRMKETLLAPNDTAYKRWSCHSELKLLCKLCRTSPPLAMGDRFTVFWACRPCGPAGWLALLLTKAGDVETNPGPTTLNKKVWIDIHKVQQDWTLGAPQMCRYPPSTIHRYLDLPSTQRIQTHTLHRHNTTPPFPTLVQAPYPLSTYTSHTTATKTQTHV